MKDEAVIAYADRLVMAKVRERHGIGRTVTTEYLSTHKHTCQWALKNIKNNNDNLRLLESRHTTQPTPDTINKLPRRTVQVQVPARRPGITTTGFSTGKKLPHDGAKRLH